MKNIHFEHVSNNLSYYTKFKAAGYRPPKILSICMVILLIQVDIGQFYGGSSGDARNYPYS
jgi:hypothetical protein